MFFVFKSLKIKHGNGMCCKVMGILSQKMIMLCFYITHTHVNLQDKIIEIEAQLFFLFEDMFNLVIWVWPFHNSWDIVSRLVYFMYICRRVFLQVDLQILPRDKVPKPKTTKICDERKWYEMRNEFFLLK